MIIYDKKRSLKTIVQQHKINTNQIDESHWKKGNGLEKGMGREGQTLQSND